MVRFQRIYPATPEAVRLARRDVVSHLRACAADGEALADVALAVSEACTNVVVHAYRHAEDPGEMLVLVRDLNGRTEVCVVDRGSGMAPRLDSPGMGLGLALISQAAAAVAVRSPDEGGTEVCMQFEPGSAIAA